MPNPLTPDFVTKKAACRTYNRSHRQLTRDLGAAMAARDETILANFKVRTEDGDVLDGIDITTDLISTLRSDGRNPMWYVRAAWMDETFGRRGDRSNPSAPDETESVDDTPEPERELGAGAPDEIVVLLKEQIRKLEDDKRDLQDDKKALREELKHRHEHALQTNLLMQDLHKLLAHMQTGLLPERTVRGTRVNDGSVTDSVAVDVDQVQAEEGTTHSPKRASRKVQHASRRSHRRTSENPAIPKKKQNPPSIWQRDLRDILSFRRK